MSRQAIDGPTTGYEALAAEYYDAQRHPTCANFREGSRAILTRWLQPDDADSVVYCDVGAGKSLLAEIVAPWVKRLDRLFLIDDSPTMLAYSDKWINLGAHLMVGDVSRFIPLASDSVDVVVASLGDPYNVEGFWTEVRRVLRSGGRAFFTTPSFEWALAYRARQNGGFHTSEFELMDGRSVSVPSHILPQKEQVDLVERPGLIVDEVANVPISALGATALSPKLLVLSGPNASVVTGYAISSSRAK